MKILRRASYKNTFRKFAFIAFLFVSSQSHLLAQQHLVIVGGGERPVAAMAKFVEWAGGRRAHILIIPWATEAPDASFASLKKDMSGFEPNSIEMAPIAPITEEKKQNFLNQLKASTGVFFTGGDQVKIMNVLKDKALLQALRARYASGTVFGGTSAGTTIMSAQMITGEGDLTVIDAKKVETIGGLGLLPNDIIVDQHFIKRQRQNRLFGLILNDRTKFGIGIDEDTALAISGNRTAEVIGANQVMTVRQQGDGSLVVRLLFPGDVLDLKTQKTSMQQKKVPPAKQRAAKAS